MPPSSIFDTYDAQQAPSLALFSNLAVSPVQGADSVSWSPEDPARVSLDGGKYSWSLKDELAFPRHAALPGDSWTSCPATTAPSLRPRHGPQDLGRLDGERRSFFEPHPARANGHGIFAALDTLSAIFPERDRDAELAAGILAEGHDPSIAARRASRSTAVGTLWSRLRQ